MSNLILSAILSFQATGEDYSVEPAETRRPFRALLDVGLIKTTTGNRVFGALKVFSCLVWPLIAVFLVFVQHLVAFFGRG